MEIASRQRRFDQIVGDWTKLSRREIYQNNTNLRKLLVFFRFFRRTLSLITYESHSLRHWSRFQRDCSPHRDVIWLRSYRVFVPLLEQVTGWEPNDTRGCSYLFGPEVVTEFLRTHGLDLVCRAHQVRRAAMERGPTKKRRHGEVYSLWKWRHICDLKITRKCANNTSPWRRDALVTLVMSWDGGMGEEKDDAGVTVEPIMSHGGHGQIRCFVLQSRNGTSVIKKI